jgi:type VI secretion system secreted protein VgrG
LGFHARPTLLVLTFSGNLDPARAVNLSNYRLEGPDGRVIVLRSASYDSVTRTVTLEPRRLLPLRRTFRLTVHGNTATAVADRVGNLLDGDRDGRPGGDFTVTITRDLLRLPEQLRAHRSRT